MPTNPIDEPSLSTGARRFCTFAHPAIFAFALAAHPSLAADIHVYSSGAPAQVAQIVGAAFSDATGHRVSVSVAPVAEIRHNLAAAPAPDVVILPAPVIDALDRAGTFDSRTELARVGIGVAVRAGARTPDISTEDAVRRLLVEARSIVHSDPAGGGFAGAQIARMMARLGIADLVRSKTSYMFAIRGGTVAVARGDAEIGLFNVSEILADNGVTLAGPLPRSLQSYITFVGAVRAGGASADAARAFLRALIAADARDAWTAAGFEPLDARP